MTKKEIIDALAKYDDSTIIYNAGNRRGDVELMSGYDYASKMRDEDIKWRERRRDTEFREVEDAEARIAIANSKLAKKETKRWRTELERATRLLEYHKGMYESEVSWVAIAKDTEVKDYMKRLGLV